MSLAVWRLLAVLYRGIEDAVSPATDIIPEMEWRNQEIVRRYMAGERVVDLAMDLASRFVV